MSERPQVHVHVYNGIDREVARPDADRTAPNNPTQSFDAGRCCPRCGGSVVGIYYRREDGQHQHTKYLCLSWPSGASEPCDWSGWTVPGPDGEL